VLHSANSLGKPTPRHGVRNGESARDMGPIGWPELVILLVVVLIVFGPGKLPDIGNAIGRGVREFRKASNDLEESIRGETKPPESTSTTSSTTPPTDPK
jgi:sec-independent protein translocase protein TatA